MSTQATAPAPFAPLIISVAPTGARLGKADHSDLPLTSAEIARTAAASREAGAAMIHLHVRDQDGGHLLDAEAYRDAIQAIRNEVGDQLIVQVTSESGGRYAAAEQMAVIRALRPEAVSVALREIIPDPDAERAGAGFLHWLHGEGVMIQYIAYSPQGVTRFQDLCRRGLVPGDRHFQLFVLGRHSLGQTSMPADLLPFLSVHDRGDPWALCAFGRWENACALTATALGGHSRIGFENNLFLSDGSPAPDNAALVAQVRDGAALAGRALADAAAARNMLLCGPSLEGLRTVGGTGQ